MARKGAGAEEGEAPAPIPAAGGATAPTGAAQGEHPIPQSLGEREMRLIYDFTSRMVSQFRLFIKTVAVFGSFARGDITEKGDIDILVIVDDGSLELRGEVKRLFDTEMQRIIDSEHSPLRFHVNTLPLSEFWDGVRTSDPILLNIVREGLPIFDRGFFVPFKRLLEQGKIRPTTESIFLCLDNADAHLVRHQEFLIKSVNELYWAAIDAVHAALMSERHVPPDPKEAARLLRSHLVAPGLVDERYAVIMDELYRVMKRINHGELTRLSGDEVDSYAASVNDLVAHLKQFVREREAEGLAKIERLKSKKGG
jgi:predicted nucleotidyltransferase